MKKFLNVLAAEAGKILLKYFRTDLTIEYKSRTNPVTRADRESEQKIKSLIRKRFPNDRFICEESCPLPAKIDDKKRYWIVDPLDGTVNFTHGFGTFCVSIAVMENRQITAGVVSNPFTGEIFFAEKGKGTFRNGKKTYVSRIAKMPESLLVTGFPYYTYKNPKNVFALFNRFAVRAQGIRRLGSAALDLCYAAEGIFEGFWEENLGPWDVAAGSLIVKEAGGTVTDFSGGEDYIFGGNIVASNSKIHKNMLKIIDAAGQQARAGEKCFSG